MINEQYLIRVKDYMLPRPSPRRHLRWDDEVLEIIGVDVGRCQ